MTLGQPGGDNVPNLHCGADSSAVRHRLRPVLLCPMCLYGGERGGRLGTNREHQVLH